MAGQLKSQADLTALGVAWLAVPMVIVPTILASREGRQRRKADGRGVLNVLGASIVASVLGVVVFVVGSFLMSYIAIRRGGWPVATFAEFVRPIAIFLLPTAILSGVSARFLAEVLPPGNDTAV